jgi:lipoprotein signal peptidase
VASSPRAQPVARLLAWTAALAMLDQACKALIRANVAPGQRIALVPGLMSLVGVRNYRGVSSWVPDLPEWAHAALTVALLVILLGAIPLYRFYAVYRRCSGWAVLASVLLGAAAAGHLLDGAVAPYTTDWLQLFRLPAFNLADAYVFSGLACLAVELRWTHAQCRGLSLGERIAQARQSRREFLVFLKNAARRW